jgi:hypothetical protein
MLAVVRRMTAAPAIKTVRSGLARVYLVGSTTVMIAS